MSLIVFKYLEDCHSEYMSHIERMSKTVETKVEYEVLIACLHSYRVHLERVEETAMVTYKNKFAYLRLSDNIARVWGG